MLSNSPPNSLVGGENGLSSTHGYWLYYPKMLSNSPLTSKNGFVSHKKQEKGGKMNTATSNTLIGQQDGTRPADQLFKTDFSNARNMVGVPLTNLFPSSQPSSPSKPFKMPSLAEAKSLLHIADQMVVALGYESLYPDPPPKPEPLPRWAIGDSPIMSAVVQFNTTIWRLGKLLHDANPDAFTLRDWNRMTQHYHHEPFDRQPESKEARTLGNKFFAHHTDKVVLVHRRPALDPRPLGMCYSNSAKEMKQTKNSVAFVLIDMGGGSGDGVKLLCPHAINYDPSTKTYYDTTELSTSASVYPAFLINDAVKPFYKNHPLHTILNGGKTIDQTYGSLLTLFWEGKTYGFRAYDHNSEVLEDGSYGHFRRYELVEELTA